MVTGAMRDIGGAVVDGLAEAGWAVLAVDRCADVEDVNHPWSHPADLEAGWLGRVKAVSDDVRDAAALAAVVSQTKHDHGDLDPPVAAAAVIGGGKVLWNEPPQTLRRLWDINVRGLRHLAAHITAKHAVVGPVLGLAADLRGTGAMASAVSAGSTHTPMLPATTHYGLEGPQELSAHRLVEWLAGKMAAAMCWLRSEQSCSMTGSALHTDGGLTT